MKLNAIVDELGRIFGEHYDRTLGNIERYLNERPALRQKFNDLGLGFNKRAVMILGDLANARYGLR